MTKWDLSQKYKVDLKSNNKKTNNPTLKCAKYLKTFLLSYTNSQHKHEKIFNIISHPEKQK